MMWELLQDAKDKGLAQASSSRLFILHFSDPRSHWVYRKSQYYQGGMRCFLMSLLLQVLSDMLQIPSTTFPLPHICPKPKVKLSPTDSFYPAPPSFKCHSHCHKPRQIGLTDRDLGLTEMGLQTLCCLLQYFWSHRNLRSVPPRLQCKLSVSFL